MFWRNNYLNDETLNEYLNSDDRTNFTYTESLSYKAKSPVINVDQPKLFRYSIHSNNLESNETNVNSDCIMRSKSNSAVTTPRLRRVFLPNTKRVLRSKVSNGSTVSERTDDFVREVDIDDEEDETRSYHIGSLNTNSNNSGPDEVERPWTNKAGTCDYHLSADEDQGSDTASAFNTNITKVKKSIPAQKRTSNQWFQKNMFGLPNDESDDIHPELSGAISGDEQYDIASFENSNAFQKSRISKSKLQKSSKSVANHKRSDSMLCSPLAVLSYLIEYLWLVMVTITRVMRRMGRHITNYSSSPRWYLVPLFLPGDVVGTVAYSCAYSIDRIFGTVRLRRWLSSVNHTKRSTFVRLLFNLMWLLFLVGIVWILMRPCVNNRHSDSSTIKEVSEYLYPVVGKECMVAEDCCHSNWNFGRRLAFCLVSLPMRFIASKTEAVSKTDDAPALVIPSNVSNLNQFLSDIESRLIAQEELMKMFHSRMSSTERQSSNNISPDNTQTEKLMELTKDMVALKMLLSKLQVDFQQINTTRSSSEWSGNSVSDSYQESIRSVTLDVEKLKEKLEKDMNAIHTLIQKSDNFVEGSSKRAINLENLLAKVQESISNLTIGFNEVYERTSSLEIANEKLYNSSVALREEVLKEIVDGTYENRREEIIISQRLNEQISKIEETLDKNYSKLLDQTYFNTLIESHLDNIVPRITRDVNSTMWAQFKEHLSTLLKQSDFRSESLPLNSGLMPTRPCHCPAFACRCQNSCVRVSKVREMLKDALQMYSADRIGQADFALESAGGTIATTRCTETYTDRAATLTIFGIPLLRLTNSPRTIIQPNINPGECWAMKGSKGSVVVQLSARVMVTAVTIDHIPKSISPSGSIDSAIKKFEIKALTAETDLVGESLGNFTFQIDSRSVQTFYIKEPVATNLVEMVVNSNYGNNEYTCIYRLRVHGNLI